MTGTTTVLEPAARRFADADAEFFSPFSGPSAAPVIAVEAEVPREEGEAYVGKHRATDIPATGRPPIGRAVELRNDTLCPTD